MALSSDGKWFWVEPPTDPLAPVAKEILAARLQDVDRWLPLAARHDAEDAEFVHQLRVSCRRSAAALRAFDGLAGRKSRKLRRWLRRLRQAAGPARDADVYLARLHAELDSSSEHAQRLVDIIAQSRREAQEALVRVEAKAARGSWRRAADKCLAAVGRVKEGAAQQSFAQFAGEAIAGATAGFRAIDPRAATLTELHELRIAAKRLRYAIELFHSAAAPTLRSEAYPLVEEIQERLGAVNDRLTSQARLQRWLGELPAEAFAGFIAAIVASEHAAAQRLRQDFLDWWTPAQEARLNELLETAFA